MIEKLQPLMDMLEKYAKPYDVVYTNFPGRIVYEDEWQVAVYSDNAPGRICPLSATHLPMHFGHGKELLDFCKDKVRIFGGTKITIGIVEENAVLKNWYTSNGFVHVGTKGFDHLPFSVGFMEWGI